MPSFKVFAGGEPYGSCVYRSPRDKSFYVFITSKDGDVEQYRIEAGDPNSSASPIRAKRVRTLSVGSTAEGCVADHELGWIYVGEEDVGIWRYRAEPDSGADRTLIARVGENGLAADVEGLTIYYAAGTEGYLYRLGPGREHIPGLPPRRLQRLRHDHRSRPPAQSPTSARPTGSM